MTTGSITATVVTSGATLDSDGYVVRIGAAEETVGVDGSVTFSGNATGSQSVPRIWLQNGNPVRTIVSYLATPD